MQGGVFSSWVRSSWARSGKALVQTVLLFTALGQSACSETSSSPSNALEGTSEQRWDATVAGTTVGETVGGTGIPPEVSATSPQPSTSATTPGPAAATTSTDAPQTGTTSIGVDSTSGGTASSNTASSNTASSNTASSNTSSSNTASSAPTTASTGEETIATETSTTSTETATTTATSTATEATTTTSTAEGPAAVHLVGRFASLAEDQARFAWSGSGMIASFEGDEVSVQFNDGGNNQFTVVLDSVVQPTLNLQSGSHSYPLATGLSAGAHTVEVYRRTEASFGATTFEGFNFGPSGQLLAPPRQMRRIELIGDSISCGYGNEGTSPSCGFTADTENHYLTYGAIAARELNAELFTIAWSGKGVIYNYDTDTVDPMPALYGRTLPEDANSVWDFSVIPDVVVINLGTNDFSTDGDPTADLFRSSYVALLERVRSHYSDAVIVCTVGPLLSGADLDAARAGIQSAVDERRNAGDMKVNVWELNASNDNPGCSYHPSVPTHEIMAAAMVTELKRLMGW